MQSLPIHNNINEIKSNFQNYNKLILQAPPGSGKSTVVPISFLQEPWLKNKKIIVLQPRRVATRMVSTYMAKSLGQKVGQTVGYIIKDESIQSKNTKVLVVTEAILTRMLQNDQSLDNVAMVIFDEYHERSIHTDLTLALCLQVQELLRDDLKILLMSATLNSKEAVKLLGKDTKVISTQGRNYDIKNIYLRKNILLNKNNIYSLTLDTILYALKNDTGDILVFLDGVKHINYLKNILEKNKNINDTLILPLYSSLTKHEQDKAVTKQITRKIILSTNIAQTSLTIDGVTIVIDTGYEKQSNYDHTKAMNKLDTKFISIDSAIQRAGRAGRQSDGICYKIWHQNKILEQSDKPEILRSDLSTLMMDLALWGEDIQELKFLDIPKIEFINITKNTLFELNMIDNKDHITTNGKISIALGLHPRYTYMILQSINLSCSYEACLLAAIFSSTIKLQEDIKTNFISLYESTNSDFISNQILKQAQQYHHKIKYLLNKNIKKQKFSYAILGVLVAFAYPDRIAKQRKKDSFLYKLSNGKGAMLHTNSLFFNERFLCVPNLMSKNKDSLITSAIAINIEQIREYFNKTIRIQNELIYNKKENTLSIQQHSCIMNLVVSTKLLSLNDIEDKKAIFLDLLKENGLELLNITNKVEELISRVNFINCHIPNQIRDISKQNLLNTIDVWIEPYLTNINKLKELKTIDIYSLILGLLTWEEQKLIEQYTPLYIQVPSGSNIKLHYEDNKVILKVKLQEIFGLYSTPKLINDKISIQIHILSPALRQIAITDDLKSFWDNSYDEAAKSLRGKYKRHYWPEDPYNAIATNKTKKHMMNLDY